MLIVSHISIGNYIHSATWLQTKSTRGNSILSDVKDGGGGGICNILSFCQFKRALAVQHQPIVVKRERNFFEVL